MDPLEMDVGSVSVFSLCAVRTAREYVELTEEQLSKAHIDERSAALQKYLNIPDRDETDYKRVRDIDRTFKEGYSLILRCSEVVYLYMIFETYTNKHMAEIALQKKLPKFKPKQGCGLVRAAQTYLQEHLGRPLLNEDDWAALDEIRVVRNCIIHSGRVARGKEDRKLIQDLASRKWKNQPVGIETESRQGEGIEQSIAIERIERRFLEYCLDLLGLLFNAMAEQTHAEFWNKEGT